MIECKHDPEVTGPDYGQGDNYFTCNDCGIKLTADQVEVYIISIEDKNTRMKDILLGLNKCSFCGKNNKRVCGNTDDEMCQCKENK